jgi:hypothetical protein
MTTHLPAPISGFDEFKSYSRYFSRLAKTRDHNGRDLGLVVDTAVMLSAETIYPSILKLSRRVETGDIAVLDGWTIKTVSTGRAEDSTFVMEHEVSPGGFLFNCQFRTERIVGVDKEVVSRITCCAYRGDGLFPLGYSGFGEDLDETIKIGFDGSKYQSGQLFSYAPSIHLQLIGPSFGRILVDPSSPVKDPVVGLQALAILGSALLELGYEREIDARVRMIGELSLDHTKTTPADIALIEMGAGALTDGIVGERITELCHHFWARAVALDVGRVVGRLRECIEFMVSGGFKDPDTAFEWQGGDKSAFVERSSEGAMVWLETEQTAYRIDVKIDAVKNEIVELTAAMVGNGRTATPRPTPQTRGYLGEFVRDGKTNDLSTHEIGEMTTTNIKGTNGFINSIGYLSDAIEAIETLGDTVLYP